jgi:hypothetical protein
MKSVLSALGASAVLCVAFTGSASATPIIGGVANITGTVSVSMTAINFGMTFGIPVGASETGAFVGTTGGTIQSLTVPPYTSLTGTVSPPLGVDFATFTGGPMEPIMFDLTSIPAGTGTNANCATNGPGNCTPTGSPFTLTQLNGGVSVGLTLNGIAYTGSSASGSTPTVGVFTTQVTIDGGTITGILGILGGGGTISGQTYSASFTATPTPEPSTALSVLFGAGLIGFSLIGRKRLGRTT